MPILRHPRGTRAALNTLAAASGLQVGQIYLITDESRIAIATAINAYQADAKQSEAETWIKLAADVVNSTTAMANVTGLSFTAVANTTYIVDLVATFQSAATTTGIGLALSIPSGSVSGTVRHPITITTDNSTSQVVSGATISATTGVKAAAANTPMEGRYIVAIGATGGAVQLQFASEVAASAVTMKAALTAMSWRAI